MSPKILKVEAFPLRIPRDVPYLGPLENGITVSEKGYFVRPGNKSVYSIHDQSTLVRVTAEDGIVGWGECVAFVVPEVPARLIHELLGPFLTGRRVSEVTALYREMYDLMRVRGFFGGYFHDAIAAVDIALWDAFGKSVGLPVGNLLGGKVSVPLRAYVSGLPKPTLAERADLAVEWKAKGFRSFKFAAAIAHGGPVKEMETLRKALGDESEILCDMHWKYTAPEAIALVDGMDAFDLAVAEAPCAPEDVEGQARVAAAVRCPVGLGEELRTSFEFLPRFEKRCMGIIQPEMGRTGITAFMEIAALARAHHVRIMPHASIGVGIFQAASLHASAAVSHFVMHEYQHSVFDANLPRLETSMRCEKGWFHLGEESGLGLAPGPEILRRIGSPQ